MPTNVGFRITGMYFGSEKATTNEIRVDVASATPTVYEVMVEVTKKVAGGGVSGVDGFLFDPLFPSPNDSLKSFTIKYSLPPKAPYAFGVYFLQENKMGNPVYVWQYYIFDKNYKQKNNDNNTAKFNASPDAPIENDDVIVWRQVAIMQGPNGGNLIAADMASGMSGLRQRGIL